MAPIVAFLAAKQTPLLVNVYPYFAYAGDSDTTNIKLGYPLFQGNSVVVQDGSLGYTNLFDAMVDSVYSALEKTSGSGVEVVASETGWPSAGDGTGATIDNARTYNNNVVGTPKRTRTRTGTGTDLFAMFNENQKPAGTEQNFGSPQNFGLYHPDMTVVYPVDFSS